ncbi:MAG: hypothetical protein Q7R64_01105 [bacterium]|nr:hypothetical protein [bacterium]
MLSLLSKLQQKPERARKQIAFLFSMAVTGIIVIFWIVSISVGDFASETVSDTKDEPGPFDALTDGLSVFWNDTSETLQGAVGALSGPENTLPEPTEEETASQISE